MDDKEFGRGLSRHLSGQDIEIDGRIEIDWENQSKDKKIFAHYKIYDIDNKLVKSGSINYYNMPQVAVYDIVYYIVYEIAKGQGIYKPSNFISEEGEFRTGGISQPNLDGAKIKKYWHIVSKYL